MPDILYRLRTLSPNTCFSQSDIYGGEWAGEPHDELLDAGREFVARKGRGTLRIMRDQGGHPRALLHRELREVNEFIRLIEDGEEAKKARAAA